MYVHKTPFLITQSVEYLNPDTFDLFLDIPVTFSKDPTRLVIASSIVIRIPYLKINLQFLQFINFAWFLQVFFKNFAVFMIFMT